MIGHHLLVGKCPMCTNEKLHKHPVPLPIMEQLLQDQDSISPEDYQHLLDWGEPDQIVVTVDLGRIERLLYVSLAVQGFVLGTLLARSLFGGH